MVLEREEVIQDVKCRHGEGDEGIGNNEDMVAEHIRQKESQERDRKGEECVSSLYFPTRIKRVL